MRKWALLIGGLSLLAGCGISKPVSHTITPNVAVTPRIDIAATEYGEVKLAAKKYVKDGIAEFTMLDGEPYDASFLDDRTLEYIEGNYAGRGDDYQGVLFVYPEGLPATVGGLSVQLNNEGGAAHTYNYCGPLDAGSAEYGFATSKEEEFPDSIFAGITLRADNLIAKGDLPIDDAIIIEGVGRLTVERELDLSSDEVVLLQLHVDDPDFESRFEFRIYDSKGYRTPVWNTGSYSDRETGEQMFALGAIGTLQGLSYEIHEGRLIGLKFAGLDDRG